MEADLETAVEFLLAAHNDDSQRGTGRSRALIDRILLRYTMGVMGAHALVLVHSRDFVTPYVQMLWQRSRAMDLEATGHSNWMQLPGTRISVSTETSEGQCASVDDTFEDHFRFATRLQRLLDNRNSNR